MFSRTTMTMFPLTFAILSLVAISTTTDAQETQDPSQIGCFEPRNLTCDVDLNVGDQDINVNLACLYMEATFIRNSGGDISLARTDQDTMRYQSFLSHLTWADNNCYLVQNAYHKCWWCAKNVPDNFCKFETTECAVPDYYNQTAIEASGGINETATCEEMQELHDEWGGKAYPATIEFCIRAELAAPQCPDLYCDLQYLGADTERKRKSLVWLSRTAAFLSLLGAWYILYDVASNKKNRKLVYHQLLFAMACFDVITALAWAFATAPVPEEKFWVYGASGSDATCTAQAFFVQLGFTSIFYNVSLALYYVLVVVRDWREFNLVKIRPYMHGLPLLVGFALAFAGIPFYDWFEYGCHLLPPPDGEEWQVWVFAVAPIGFSILCVAGAMGTVYYKVRQQANKAKKWSMGNKSMKKGAPGGARNALERTVFYQSIFYIMSFLISWPILFAMYLFSVDVDGPYGLTATIAFVAPLQGFNNFLVYIRPKVNQWRRDRQKKREKQSRFNSSMAATAGESADGSFFRRLRGSGRGFRLSSRFSFFSRSESKSKLFQGVSNLSNLPNMNSTDQRRSTNSDASMSQFDGAVTGFNQFSAVSGTCATENNSFTTLNYSHAESLDEFETEDPSVLIARDDRDEILTKHDERMRLLEQQEKKAPESAIVVPDTIEEGEEPAAEAAPVSPVEGDVLPAAETTAHTVEPMVAEASGETIAQGQSNDTSETLKAQNN